MGWNKHKLIDQFGQEREHIVAIFKCFHQACVDSIRQIELALSNREAGKLALLAGRLRASVAKLRTSVQQTNSNDWLGNLG